MNFGLDTLLGQTCKGESTCITDMFTGSFPMRHDELGKYPTQGLLMSFASTLGRSCCPRCKHIYMRTEPEA